jgi:hypothetical protein
VIVCNQDSRFVATLIEFASLTLPVLSALQLAWVVSAYRRNLIQHGFAKRLRRALIVVVGVSIAVFSHWNYDWYATIGDEYRHVFLLGTLCVALVLAFSVLLEPLWERKRARLLSLHALTLAAFGAMLFGTLDPEKLTAFPYAFFTFFIITIVLITETAMIWLVATGRQTSSGTTPRGTETAPGA